MSKKPKTKRQGVKDLLRLLGADPNEPAPTGLREAEFRCDLEGVEQQEKHLDRCETTGKVCFTSESQAKQAARRRLNKGSNTSSIRVYRCESCPAWHMTSSFSK